MEVLSSSVAIFLWEYALKPVVDSIKNEYGNETKELLKSLVHNILEKEKIESKELKIIEAEIINAPADVLSDKEKFLEFVKSNEKFKEISTSLNKIKDSKIDIALGEGGKLDNSVNEIKNSTIKIR